MSTSKPQKPAQRASKRLHGFRAGKRHDFDMFEPFPKLPLELRLKIWTLSLPRSQIQSPKDIYREGYSILLHRAQNPVALSVSRESRAVALRYYTPRDPHKLHRYQQMTQVKYASYVDFSRDRFVFPSKSQLGCSLGRPPAAESDETWREMNWFFAKEEWRKIAKMRIFSGDFSFTESQIRELLGNWLPLLDGLREFTFTILLDPEVKDVFKDWDGATFLVEDRLRVYNECVKVILETFSDEQAAVGVVWKVPEFKVDVVRALVDKKSGSWSVDLRP